MAVHTHNVGLRRIAVAHVGHVVDVDDRAVHRLDGQIVQIVNTVGAELVSTWYSKRSILMVPEGAIMFCAPMALTTSAGDSPLACSACHIEVDLDLALLAAVGKRRLRAFDRGQLGANGVGGQVVQLLLVEALAAKAQLQNGNAGSVVLNDERRKVPGGRLRNCDLADGSHLGDRLADVHMGLEEDLDDRRRPPATATRCARCR